MSDVTTYVFALFLGIRERGGMPLGLRSEYVLLRETKEEEPSAEEVTEVVEEEIPSDAEPAEAVAEVESQPEPEPESEPVPEPESEPVEPEPEPEPVVEAVEIPPEPEEPVVTEEQPEKPEPEPEKVDPHFVFEPEHPVSTDSPVVVNGWIHGYEQIKGKEHWVKVNRRVEGNGTELVGDVPCTFEGERAVAVG